jgi:hypothetical protein
MRFAGVRLALLCGLLLPTVAPAGLYCSQETIAALPSQWRGFLRDHRQLRGIAATAAPLSPARKAYQQEAARLTEQAARRPLDAEEAAELGAFLLRLGETSRALAVLQPAQRRHPRHFHLAANLGTAWQASGDLSQAAACLEQAVRLAPAIDRKNEELHLRLVRGRLRQSRDTDGLDDLFGVRYVGPGGYEPGRLAEEQRRRLPAESVARLQQLALWLPADGRLLWQLGELSAVQGDILTASSILDICFIEYGLRSAQLRNHRHVVRAAAEALRRDGRPPVHEVHAGLLRPRSAAPLVRKPDSSELPVDPSGVNRLPWSLLMQTHMDRHYRPTFADALRRLEGKRVRMEGFLQPLNEDDLGVFLLVENPVGCWHCEQPDVTAIVMVQMPAGKEHHYTRDGLRVTGRLKLNATDPESFLYVLADAKVEDVE